MDAIRRSDGEAVLREAARLDGALAEHGDRLDPRLAHFLGNRSYPKALRFLDEAAAAGRP